MIDRRKLLDMMDGDEAIVAKFLAAFKAQVTVQLPLIHAYMQQGDREMLSNSVHVMKTQTGYLGLDELSILAQNIEARVDAGASLDVLSQEVSLLVEKLTQVILHELP